MIQVFSDFDELVDEHYMTNDYINLAANVCQVFFFGAVSKNERTEPRNLEPSFFL